MAFRDIFYPRAEDEIFQKDMLKEFCDRADGKGDVFSLGSYLFRRKEVKDAIKDRSRRWWYGKSLFSVLPLYLLNEAQSPWACPLVMCRLSNSNRVPIRASNLILIPLTE